MEPREQKKDAQLPESPGPSISSKDAVGQGSFVVKARNLRAAWRSISSNRATGSTPRPGSLAERSPIWKTIVVGNEREALELEAPI